MVRTMSPTRRLVGGKSRLVLLLLFFEKNGIRILHDEALQALRHAAGGWRYFLMPACLAAACFFAWEALTALACF